MSTNKSKILVFIKSSGGLGVTNTDIREGTGIEPHQQIFQITRKLREEGLIQGSRQGWEWVFFPLGTVTTLDPPAQSGRRKSKVVELSSRKFGNPWERGPTELIAFARNLAKGKSDTHKRIAFLILDVGVETLLRTSLILPERITGAITSFASRKKSAEGNFYALIKGTEEAFADAIQVDLDHIQWFHDIRNKLYHEGAGITVTKEDLNIYLEIALDLLENLMGLNLSVISEKEVLDIEPKGELPRFEEKVLEITESKNVISDVNDIREIRKRFWGQLIIKAKNKSPLHAQSQVKTSNNISANAGIPNVNYRYMIRKESGVVALFIDHGDRERNKQVYNQLALHREKINREYGESLEWNPYESSRNYKIQKRINIGGYAHEEKWGEIQDEMIDAMIRLEKALSPHIRKLKV